MLITRIELHNYKPFSHGGITTLEANIQNGVVFCLGQNGCGKSSLLKELDVFPPTSTDFNKGGYKRIWCTHDGSDYELKSTFTGKLGKHSFIKDGEELNISQNGTTQQSLCETHLGHSVLHRDIAAGNIEISRLKASERKALLAACYPSNLTFILDKHKQIVSKLREVKNNIKLLKTRELELKTEMIDESGYSILEKLMTEASTMKQSLSVIRNDIVKSMTKHKIDNVAPIDYVDISNTTEKLMSKTLQMRAHYPTLFERPVYETLYDITSQLTQTNNEIDAVVKSGVDLVSEIDQYKQLVNSSIEDDILALEQERVGIVNGLAKLSINNALPELVLDDNVTYTLQQIATLVIQLHEIDSPTYYTAEELYAKQSTLEGLVRTMRQAENELTAITEQLSAETHRLEKAKITTYNPKCALACGLKDNYDNLVSEISDVISAYEHKRSAISIKLAEVSETITMLQNTLVGPTSAMPIINKLTPLISDRRWEHFMLNGESLINVLSTNLLRVRDKAVMLLENTIELDKYNTWMAKLIEIDSKLKIMKESQLPTKQLVTRQLAEKQVLLTNKRAQHAKLIGKQLRLSATHNRLNALNEMSDTITKLRDTTSAATTDALMNARYQLDVENLEFVDSVIAAVDSEQASIQASLNKQYSLRVRLKEEVMPNLEKLEALLVELMHMEKALSPTCGLSQVYMTRFSNAMIENTNALLKAVWNYNIELIPSKESSTLDYSLPVRLHNKGRIKDVSIGSKAQQRIINLAYTIALYAQLGLGEKLALKLDEPDSGLSETHRTKLLVLLSNLVKSGKIKQLIIVNHHSSLFTAFANAQTICLDSEGILLPQVYNQGVEII